MTGAHFKLVPYQTLTFTVRPTPRWSPTCRFNRIGRSHSGRLAISGLASIHEGRIQHKASDWSGNCTYRKPQTNSLQDAVKLEKAQSSKAILQPRHVFQYTAATALGHESRTNFDLLHAILIYHKSSLEVCSVSSLPQGEVIRFHKLLLSSSTRAAGVLPFF
jgi:hypothetical protein